MAGGLTRCVMRLCGAPAVGTSRAAFGGGRTALDGPFLVHTRAQSDAAPLHLPAGIRWGQRCVLR